MRTLRLLMLSSMLCIAGSAARAQALPGLTYTTTIVSDQNASAVPRQMPLSTLNLGGFTQAIGSPPAALRFTTAGNYKVVARFLVTSDLSTNWSFGLQLDLATPGTYVLPTVTTPMTFAAGVAPSTYVAVMTVDALYVNVGDALSFAASVEQKVAGASHVIAPKVLSGLASTYIALTTLP